MSLTFFCLLNKYFHSFLTVFIIHILISVETNSDLLLQEYKPFVHVAVVLGGPRVSLLRSSE